MLLNLQSFKWWNNIKQKNTDVDFCLIFRVLSEKAHCLYVKSIILKKREEENRLKKNKEMGYETHRWVKRVKLSFSILNG